jgi:methionyl-tRNA formyltransferase
MQPSWPRFDPKIWSEFGKSVKRNMEPSFVSPPFAFFGTPYVARDTLAKLMASGYVPSVVVTSPDAKRGRGLELAPSETKIYAEAAGLPVLTPEKLDETFLQSIATFGCQYAVVVAYGKLLPLPVIEAFPLGVLNIHYSLLPKYRGASPVEAALLNGDTETGVTIQRMVLKMDAGEILAQKAVAIEEDDTVGTLRPRLIEAGTNLLIETLPGFLSGASVFTAQDESLVSFSGKITKEQGLLSLKDDPESNWRKYRAYHESPGTFFYARKGNKRIRVKILDATFYRGVFIVKQIVPESKAAQDFETLARMGWEVE